MNVRIEMICLPVNNLQKSVEWYVTNLGFTLVSKMYDNNEHALLSVGNSEFIQLVVAQNVSNMNFFNDEGYEMFPCTIKVPNVHAIHKQITDRGWDVGPCKDECGYNFKIYDPDGNRLHIWGGFIGKENEIANGIDAAYIPVSDLKSSSDWYVKYFGATLSRPGEYHFHTLPSGRTIMLIDIKGNKRFGFMSRQQNDYLGISFAVDDIEQMYKKLKKDGENIGELHKYDKGTLRLMVKDPSGNVIQVAADSIQHQHINNKMDEFISI